VTPSQTYFNALDSIANQANGAAKSFPGLKNEAVNGMLDTLRQQKFEAGDAIDAVRTLRGMADTAYRQGEKAQGSAMKQ
ncbi:hypothetical protein ABMZ17_25325, partial [Escherichia coli]|uniref:hypothetical protein n=1 Tax=Escherichia coli TaxID=562 RepID=UPI0039BEA1D0